MIIRLSVRDRAAGEHHDLEVTLDPGAPVAALLEALPIPVAGRPCYVGAERLDPGSTFADSPLLAGCTVAVGAPGRQVRTPDDAIGALQVLDGPDSGVTAWLGPGTHLVGRADECRIRLHDHEVSRRHVRIQVATGGDATAEDLGSSNGTSIDGTRITGRSPLPEHGRIQVGGDLLRWVPLQGSRLLAGRGADGRLGFDRAFAAAPTVRRLEVVLPTLQETPRNLTGMLVTAVAPLVLAVLMAVLLRQPTMLLFALLGPVTMLGSLLGERRQRRRRRTAFEAARSTVESRIADAVRAEEELRRARTPDLATLALAATGGGRGLWPRQSGSGDALLLRVGTADLDPALDLTGEPWEGFQPPRLLDVPVTVDLAETGVLGVVGPPGPAGRAADWLILQLAILRSPDDLQLVLITSTDADDLSWARWLPHLDPGHGGPSCRIGNTPGTRLARVEELLALVAGRRAESSRSPGARWADVVVVLHGAVALRQLPGVGEVLRDGPAVGVRAICIDEQDMHECRGVCRLSDSALLLTRSPDDLPVEARPEGADRRTAEALARSLAPMRDRLASAADPTAVPFPVRLLDLFGIQAPDAADVQRLWAMERGPTTRIAIGADATGTTVIDLAGQGPHAMLAGATGAGKSVLLQTLVTALLLANRPDELNLVLVDFKGGSAFLPFERCPHVVALIRSTGETAADVFDEAAAVRMLASVRAEVSRRESLLARYGGELDAYWQARARDPDLPPLPRLVLVLDEFARVLEVSPGFLKELVNVSAKGRSLGMHLVLATQSLQGKLSAELRNNIDLRITLRQNEPADSTEVLGVPDAVGIPGRLRGRAMVVCTKDEVRSPRQFQSGYLGDPPPQAGGPPVRVRSLGWTELGEPGPAPTVARAGPTDLELTVRAIGRAAARLGLPVPSRPLLPPLPGIVRLEELTGGGTSGAGLAFGLIDDPVSQRQPVAVLDLDGTDRLLVAGGPQSGRTTAARVLLTSIATTNSPDQVHVYVLEHHPDGLAAYSELPHCGGVFSAAEPDRIRRFVTWLDGEVRRRAAARFAAAARPDPKLVVIVDGWEQFEQRSDPMAAETSLPGLLRAVVTAGPPLGVHVVAIGGQDLLQGKLSALCSRRLLLPFPSQDVRRGHLPGGVAGPPVLPGRAIDAATGLHVQLCTTDRTPDQLGRDTPAASATGPRARQFPPMPLRVTPRQLVAAAPAASTWLPVGVGGPDVEPLGLDLFEAGPQAVLVGGPAGSGRTTAAAVLAAGLRRAGIGVLAVCPPRSPLPRLLPDDDGMRLVTGTTVRDAELRAAAATFGDGRYAVVVDDCEQLTVVPGEEGYVEAPTLLADLASPGALGHRALVLCGDVTPVLAGQRRSLLRVVNEVMTTGTRVLLCPTAPAAAREQGFQLEADQFFAGPPGRGFLARGRTSELIQFACLEES